MKRSFLYTSLVLLLGCTAVAQNKDAIKFSQTITKDNAYKHLSVLASDEYEGRGTGVKGGWMAADYIKNFFKEIGLKGPVNGEYFQPVGIVKMGNDQILTIEGQPAEPITDFYNIRTSITKGYTFNANNILFAGYGLNAEAYNDFHGFNVTGKVVMILGDDVPKAISTYSAASYRIMQLSKENPKAILVVEPKIGAMDSGTKRMLEYQPMVLNNQEHKERKIKDQGIPVIYISKQVANQLLKSVNKTIDELKNKIDANRKPASIELTATISASAMPTETKVKADNVLGFLEGSDPKLKNEVLVITAHYDHIGLTGAETGDKVNNGADDDGSGTTGVMMIAEAFMKAKKAGKGPKRSILFMTVTGEERGLWGSDWYSENPVFPLKNTITNLNIDMIGRGDEAHAADNNFVYIIGSNMLSSDLHRISKKANQDYIKMNLDEKYNNRTDPNRFYYRSDHYNFAKHGIPVIFYFNGVHEDYHQPGDEISKIDFPMLAKRSKLVYFTAWELANAAKRPVVDKNEDGTIKK
ncbi:M28 family peptidase [Pedobacter sp. ASV1-7]|uniref:M28 family peptidase n=1 Tax=Pedobacter sp. ASV1-7 TaxID=3145237 RepID=UPI0032E8D80D